MVKQVAETKVATGVRVLRDDSTRSKWIMSTYWRSWMRMDRSDPEQQRRSAKRTRQRCRNLMVEQENHGRGVWLHGIVRYERQ